METMRMPTSIKLDIDSAKQNAEQMDTSKLLYKQELAIAYNDGSQYDRDWLNVLTNELQKRNTSTNTITPKQASIKMLQLANHEGYETISELTLSTLDCLTMGICCNAKCNYTIETDIDTTDNFCDECETYTVASFAALTLISPCVEQ